MNKSHGQLPLCLDHQQCDSGERQSARVIPITRPNNIQAAALPEQHSKNHEKSELDIVRAMISRAKRLGW